MYRCSWFSLCRDHRRMGNVLCVLCVSVCVYVCVYRGNIFSLHRGKLMDNNFPQRFAKNIWKEWKQIALGKWQWDGREEASPSGKNSDQQSNLALTASRVLWNSFVRKYSWESALVKEACVCSEGARSDRSAPTGSRRGGGWIWRASWS